MNSSLESLLERLTAGGVEFILVGGFAAVKALRARRTTGS